jgi:hypothetical protein
MNQQNPCRATTSILTGILIISAATAFAQPFTLSRTFDDPTVTDTDKFGFSVALDGSRVLIGAIWDDTNGGKVGQVHLFTVLTLGDTNLDGPVNGLDVDPFVEVLLSGPYQSEADMNDDQVVNGLDVDPFVSAVLGGTQPVPEPSTLLLGIVALGVVGAWRKWSV